MERIYESLGCRTPYEVYVKERLNPKLVPVDTMHHIQPVFCLDNGETFRSLLANKTQMQHVPDVLLYITVFKEFLSIY